MMSTSVAPASPPAGSSKLTGILIGTAGSYQNKGNTIANAMDGNISSYFDAPAGVQGWVGLALPTPEVITQVQFVPRSGFASRMVGGLFQGSTTSDFSSGVTTLYTVSSSPAGGVYTYEPITSTASFQYVRYLSPLSGSGNIAELEFDGFAAAPVLPPPVPSSPASLTATAQSINSIQLTWTENPTSVVTSFTIERQGPTDASFVTIGTVSGTTTTFTDTNDSAGTTYSYEVIANNTTGASSATLPVSATTPTPVVIVAPLAPANLSASAVSTSTVQLSWTEDPSSTVTTFTIEREGPTDASYLPLGTVPGTATSFTDNNVVANTTYSYELIASNAGESSPTTAPVAATTPLPPVNPWSDSDIGAVGFPGSATINPGGSITVSGSGADIWNTADAFNFESQSFVGNGSIIAQVTAESNPSSWAKSGIMIRETMNVDSRCVLLALTPGNGVTLQARAATHTTPSVSIGAAGKVGVWLELVRNGSAFTGYSSTDGVNWTEVGSVVIPMFNNVQAGLAVTAHNNSKICTATFSNVKLNLSGAASSPWTGGAQSLQAKWEAGTVSYGGLMYTFGGFIDRSLDATAEVDSYNPVTNTWSYVTTIPTGPLTHDAITLVGDTVYLAGGNIGAFGNIKAGVATAAVITYDLTTNTWGSVASLPTSVTSGGLVCINNTLIYYGGINAASTADLGGTYSLNLMTPNAGWTSDANMPDPRNHIGYAAINGIAYAVGGEHLYNQTGGNDAAVDAYNPVTNTWSAVASLPIPWSGIHGTTIVVNGKIVIVGGQTNGGYDGIYLNNIEEYDPAANTWAGVGTLPEANQGQAVAYVDGTLIVSDGTVDNQGGWAQNQTLLDSLIVL
jgi:N-acetylneuraminic acid mutarotase